MTGERGQVAVGAVGALALLVLGAALLVHLAVIRTAGARGQGAGDLAALAAARVLAGDPAAAPAGLRSAAAAAARANGGRLAWLRVEGRPGIPAAVEVGVRTGVPGAAPGAAQRADRVLTRARAGVTYSARLPAGAFRPVDVRGAPARAAAVAAAEAQIGWPYVWGGESRAEGGFDCSGLIDFAYAQAGVALPGRPTAADLWRIGRPIPAAGLQPGDLAFMGSASGAPYHVALYAGDGFVVVAPHSGARVRFEPVAGGGWDGFATLLPGGPPAPPSSAVQRAARRHGVPSHVLAAAVRLGLAVDPERAARELAAAQARHPGDLVAALGEALHDPSAAALALRAASGPGLTAFAGAVRLLPEPVGASTADAGAAVAGGGVPRERRAIAERAPARRAGGRWSVPSIANSAVGVAERGVQLVQDEGRLTLGGFAGVRHLSRIGLNVLTIVPDRTVSGLASAAGGAWDIASGVAEATSGGLESGLAASGPALWASRLTAAGGLVAAVAGGVMLATGRSRRRRALGGVEAAGGALQLAGFATAGSDLIVLGAAGMEVPPVGVALILAGTAITGGVALYQAWPVLSASGLAAARRVRRLARSARDAARAAWDGARSLASALPAPWR